jgi:hypothetical protein
MPYKNPDDYNAWNRAYQRKRSMQARRVRADAESRVIGLVKTSSGQHDSLSLYRVLLSKGFDVASVEGAVKALLKARILSIDPDTLKLVLNDRIDNPFLAPQGTARERTISGLRS